MTPSLNSKACSGTKFKIQASAGKIMCTIFWEAEGTVKLRYNVFLGTVKKSTLYQRYVITTKERSSYLIINPNPVHYSALLYCFLKKLSIG